MQEPKGYSKNRLVFRNIKYRGMLIFSSTAPVFLGSPMGWRIKRELVWVGGYPFVLCNPSILARIF